MKSLFLFVLLFFCVSASGQNNGIKMQIDNDWFTDQYYSAGFELSYFRHNRSSQDSSEKFRTWFGKYGFKIYTPNVYDEESYRTMDQDRPFAGFQYLLGGIQSFSIPKNKFQQYFLRVGQVGPKAGLEGIQRSAHKLAGYEPIFGWENQIVNEVVIDANVQWLKEWRLDPDVALSLSNTGQFGTANNYFQTGVNFRIGKFDNINQSGWLQPRLSSQDSNSQSKNAEAYVVAGFSLQYVLSNIFLEGSLFDNPSPVSITPMTIFAEGNLGLYIASSRMSYALIGVFQGREFQDGAGHFYVNFNIARSF